jgi:hypothetical protein
MADEVECILCIADPDDGEIHQLKMDSTTKSLMTVDYPHHEIHGGSSYSFSRQVTIPAADDEEILIVTPDTAKWAHMIWSFICDAAFTVTVFEGTGLTTPTNLSSTIKNRNRNSDNTSGLTIGHTPAAGSGDGTPIWTFSGGANKTVTTAEGRLEFILKQNEEYLIRVAASQNDVATILLDWYEHTNN